MAKKINIVDKNKNETRRQHPPYTSSTSGRWQRCIITILINYQKILLYLKRIILMLIILYGAFGVHHSANDKNEKLAQSKQNIAHLAESMQSSKWDMGMKKMDGINSWLYVKQRIYIENCLSEEEIIKRLEYNDFLIIDKLLYSCKDGVQYNIFRPKHFDKMLNFCGYIEFSSEYPSEFEKCQSSK